VLQVVKIPLILRQFHEILSPESKNVSSELTHIYIPTNYIQIKRDHIPYKVNNTTLFQGGDKDEIIGLERSSVSLIFNSAALKFRLKGMVEPNSLLTIKAKEVFL